MNSLQQGIDFLKRHASSLFLYTEDQGYGHKREGFAVQDKNTTQFNKMKAIETQFSRALSNYSTSKKEMVDETMNYVNHQTQRSNFTGKHIQLQNGQRGYVTHQGLFKPYSSQADFEINQGQFGCPVQNETLQVPFSQPDFALHGLVQGTPMKQNQGCFKSGVNAQVIQTRNPDNLNSSVIKSTTNQTGCYRVSGSVFPEFNQSFTKQSDIQYQPQLSSQSSNSNTYSTFHQACKTRAVDLERNHYALLQDGNSNNTAYCWISNEGVDTNHIQSILNQSVATTRRIDKKLLSPPQQSQSQSSTTSASFISGVSRNGQVGIIHTQDNSIASTLNDIPVIEGCDAIYGSKIQVHSASFGSNCNGQIQLESIL
jgi:hypothetical protein